MIDSIAILDFGSQYAQLIARRLREAQVYCELFPWDSPAEPVMALNPRGFILSGGPSSAYGRNAPTIPDYVFDAGVPILGICYGMQALTHRLGGQVDPSARREYGQARITVEPGSAMLEGISDVWMSHGDRITRMPEGFVVLAHSENSPLAAIGDTRRAYYGVQFHPEVRHTPHGEQVLQRFAVQVCGVHPEWTPRSIVEEAISRVQQQVGRERVLAAVSGGVDSTVAAALVHRAVGDQLITLFVDTGLLREGERAQVAATLREGLHAELITVDAASEFLQVLHGITEPEQKRRIIGEAFIRIFEKHARQLGRPRFLVQGTIYPDVVESSAPDRSKADRIKTHHNVGGLPDSMEFELVEPLRFLFKDEVRLVGEELGLPAAMVWRQPFPGPGLAVRCLGEINLERLKRLRAADAIVQDELVHAGLLRTGPQQVNVIAQAFAVLLPVKSVGVMGDQRTYAETITVRAVTTEDFMTADWARLPHDLLARIASRIVNEVDGINRVVYDITSKPPGTIEWE